VSSVEADIGYMIQQWRLPGSQKVVLRTYGTKFIIILHQASFISHQAARQLYPFSSTSLFLPVICCCRPPAPILKPTLQDIHEFKEPRMLYSPLIHNHLYRLSHSVLCCYNPSIELTVRNNFQTFYPLHNSLGIHLMSLKKRKDLPRHVLCLFMASLSIQVMCQVKHHYLSRETWDPIESIKEISKKPFFLELICNPVHALYVIKANRHGESTGRPELALKGICSALPNLCHAFVKRLRVKFAEESTDLTPRLPIPNDFCRHVSDEATEKVSDAREPSLNEVDEYFEKAGQSSRMLGLKDLFDKSRGFGKCMTKRRIQASRIPQGGQGSSRFGQGAEQEDS
jgi:hypothetical protein